MIDSQNLTYFSFSKNNEFHTTILSAARQADYSQLKIFDQNKNLIKEIDAFDLCEAWIGSLLGNLIIGLFSGTEEKTFNSEADEKLFHLYNETDQKLKWREDLFSSESEKSEQQRIDEFSSLLTELHEKEKELRVLSYSDCVKLHKKIYMLLAGMIDCYLQVMSSNPEIPNILLEKSTFNLYKNLKQSKLRTIIFCSAIKDYILVESEYQEFLSKMERKFLDMLHEWYF